MDLMILVYADPWSPDLPDDAALRRWCLRAFALARRAAQRVIGRHDPRQRPHNQRGPRCRPGAARPVTSWRLRSARAAHSTTDTIRPN